MAGPASPSPLNYFEGKGALFFTPTGGTRRHLGNAPSVTCVPDFQTREHFSSLTATRTLDREDVVQTGLQFRATLEEITIDNLGLFFYGDVDTDTDGNQFIRILGVQSKRGKLDFEGINAIGQIYNWEIPDINFRPEGEFDWIGEDYAGLVVVGQALAQADGSFGRITRVGGETE